MLEENGVSITKFRQKDCEKGNSKESQRKLEWNHAAVKVLSVGML